MEQKSKPIIYPPLKVVRQNSTHIFRVIFDSKAMIEFLKRNYAVPYGGERPKYFFDINLSNDETKLIASTETKYLEVVGGEPNPLFNRKPKIISPKKHGKSNKKS